MVSDTFFTNPGLYHGWISLFLLIVTIGSLVWPLIQLFREKSFFSNLSNEKRKKFKYRLLHLVLMIYYPSIVIVTITYFIGTQLHWHFYNESESDVNRIGVLIVVYIFYFLSALYLTFILRFIFKYLGLNHIFSKSDRTPLALKIDDEKWYLLYPIDNNLYLLGNDFKDYNCKNYMIVAKDKLLNKPLILEDGSKR
ncbi:hypothetical protein [Bacillus horti]|uniref:MFS family permease n=1 Tax=Caldalkalibacillus horti TaxID=77523 RepID=A0ABT9VXV4_9BACI|nr:hypothetical protein [Bacillus horti]MDQ0165710.1 MFS family permease [Bacillus horti]